MWIQTISRGTAAMISLADSMKKRSILQRSYMGKTILFPQLCTLMSWILLWPKNMESQFITTICTLWRCLWWIKKCAGRNGVKIRRWWGLWKRWSIRLAIQRNGSQKKHWTKTGIPNWIATGNLSITPRTAFYRISFTNIWKMQVLKDLTVASEGVQPKIWPRWGIKFSGTKKGWRILNRRSPLNKSDITITTMRLWPLRRLTVPAKNLSRANIRYQPRTTKSWQRWQSAAIRRYPKHSVWERKTQSCPVKYGRCKARFQS